MHSRRTFAIPSLLLYCSFGVSPTLVRSMSVRHPFLPYFFSDILSNSNRTTIEQQTDNN